MKGHVSSVSGGVPMGRPALRCDALCAGNQCVYLQVLGLRGGVILVDIGEMDSFAKGGQWKRTFPPGPKGKGDFKYGRDSDMQF